MGTLLTWWIWTQWKQRNLNNPAEDVYILNSAVSSQIVATMAKIEGFLFYFLNFIIGKTGKFCGFFTDSPTPLYFGLTFQFLYSVLGFRFQT